MVTRAGIDVQQIFVVRKIEIFVDKFGKSLDPVASDRQVSQKCELLLSFSHISI
jgi:hypothetical protein